jgi:uncharacterized RDD family membrane protein YckC
MAIYASFGRRLAALGVDGVVLAVAVMAIVYVAEWLPVTPFAAIWETPIPVHTVVEAVGAPAVVKHEGGGETTTAFSRETRIFADGNVRIYAVVESRALDADGAVMTNHAESRIAESAALYWRTCATVALMFVLPFLYFAWFEASPWQATPGKRLLALRVTDLAGGRLTPKQSFVRQGLKLMDVTSSGLTYLIAAFTERRQALHDRFAGTLVIRLS